MAKRRRKTPEQAEPAALRSVGHPLGFSVPALSPSLLGFSVPFIAFGSFFDRTSTPNRRETESDGQSPASTSVSAAAGVGLPILSLMSLVNPRGRASATDVRISERASTVVREDKKRWRRKKRKSGKGKRHRPQAKPREAAARSAF